MSCPKISPDVRQRFDALIVEMCRPIWLNSLKSLRNYASHILHASRCRERSEVSFQFFCPNDNAALPDVTGVATFYLCSDRDHFLNGSQRIEGNRCHTRTLTPQPIFCGERVQTET